MDAPFQSFFHFDSQMLLSNTESGEERESLEQAKGLLWPLQSQLERNMQNSPYALYLKRKLGSVYSIISDFHMEYSTSDMYTYSCL